VYNGDITKFLWRRLGSIVPTNFWPWIGTYVYIYICTARCYANLPIGLEWYWHWGIGYCPIFSIIGWYWVLGNTFIGCHTEYQYCLDTLIPVASRWQQGNLGGGKVKLESWQMKEIKIQTVILAFITYMVILTAILWVS